MPLTMDDVRKVLLPDEPSYSKARKLGIEALPFLQTLVMQGDTMLATKAAYLAGLIGTKSGAEVVAAAAASPEPSLRVAAVAAAGKLQSNSAAPILEKLLTDPDRGVRYRVVKSAADRLTPALRKQIERVVHTDQDRSIRSEAAALLRRQKQAPASRKRRST